ncbi:MULTISPECIES: hypothetical protein [Streptomyces]|uniref:hypothetical protein n=1 Tax=Streptomyces TaxID=1883 RepID=UPI000A74FAF2|nr:MULTISPECIES: hypothetical protein [Streptomyces]MDC7337757.1 hypothetical protein [Streptomyces lydicus]UEG92842.1 hypothetical protein LJ741_21185 [Streptomyces lydicus]
MDALAKPADGQPEPGTGVAVRDIVRSVVAELAPDELVLVEGLWRYDDDSVVARLAGRRRSREPLGFGLQEVTALITPVAWLVLDEAARKVVGTAVTSATDRTRGWLRRVTRRPAAVRTLPPLSEEQLAAVRARVLELGTESGLAPETATALAERVVARLVLRPQGRLPNDAGSDGSAEPEA